MRHEKFPRFDPVITEKNIANAERKREAMLTAAKSTLFADEFSADVEQAVDRIERIVNERGAYWQHLRDTNAANWRSGRRQLDALPADERARLIRLWNESPLPGSAGYFVGFLRRHSGDNASRLIASGEAVLKLVAGHAATQLPDDARFASFEVIGSGTLVIHFTSESVSFERPIPVKEPK